MTQDMSSTIKEAIAKMMLFCTSAVAKDLTDECMKLKAYHYFAREINKAYGWLMANESKAKSLLAKNEELW